MFQVPIWFLTHSESHLSVHIIIGTCAAVPAFPGATVLTSCQVMMLRALHSVPASEVGADCSALRYTWVYNSPPTPTTWCPRPREVPAPPGPQFPHLEIGHKTLSRCLCGAGSLSVSGLELETEGEELSCGWSSAW